MPKASFKLSVHNNLVRSEFTGQWSKKTAQRYNAETRERVQPIKHQPWGHLVLLEDWLLGTPEFEPIIIDLVTWCFHNNVKATAIVFPDNALKSYQLSKLKLFEAEDERVKYFNNQTDAKNWLAAKGFQE